MKVWIIFFIFILSCSPSGEPLLSDIEGKEGIGLILPQPGQPPQPAPTGTISAIEITGDNTILPGEQKALTLSFRNFKDDQFPFRLELQAPTSLTVTPTQTILSSPTAFTVNVQASALAAPPLEITIAFNGTDALGASFQNLKKITIVTPPPLIGLDIKLAFQPFSGGAPPNCTLSPAITFGTNRMQIFSLQAEPQKIIQILDKTFTDLRDIETVNNEPPVAMDIRHCVNDTCTLTLLVSRERGNHPLNLELKEINVTKKFLDGTRQARGVVPFLTEPTNDACFLNRYKFNANP